MARFQPSRHSPRRIRQGPPTHGARHGWEPMDPYADALSWLTFGLSDKAKAAMPASWGVGPETPTAEFVPSTPADFVPQGPPLPPGYPSSGAQPVYPGSAPPPVPDSVPFYSQPWFMPTAILVGAVGISVGVWQYQKRS